MKKQHPMKTGSNSLYPITFWSGMMCALAVPCLAFLSGSSVAADISNEPMETKIQKAPANIMFLLDNSGSMDWEFMTSENDGIFDSEYFVYAMSDNAYSNNTYALSGTKKIAWKSQWSGYNTIFYNPHSTYHPWPRWENMPDTEDGAGQKIGNGGTPPPHQADLKNPRSNPTRRAPALNLHDVYYANLPLSQRLIVDNQDPPPSFTTTGTWTESTLNPEWAGSSIYSGTVGATAVFKPKILLPKFQTASHYKIYAWWNCYTARDRNALITVDHNGDGTPDASQRRDQHSLQDNVPRAGICGEWVSLFNGATFTFPAGRQGTVSIIRDGLSSGSNTVADAIAFDEQASVNIMNAHYYTVDDNNYNGVADPGEKYLVNFTWSDTNSDTIVDPDEVARSYYLVHDNGAAGNHEVVDYVTLVDYDPLDPANDSVPDSIQPREYDQFGNPVGFISDYEDLQNFANWFSFYRKREYTSKAAVALSVIDLNWVNIGYHTINSGVSQPVLPINVESSIPTIVIVDDKDSAFTSDGTDICTRRRNNGTCRNWGPAWQQAGTDPEYERSSLYAGTSGDWAKWTPNLPAAESYKVSAWWSCNTDWDQKAKFSIRYAGGTAVKYLNQKASRDDRMTTKADCTDPSGNGCCGYWVDLGTYNFNQGVAGYVQVERHSQSTGTYTTADAVKFEGASTGAIVDSTNDLLDILYSVDSSGGTPLRLGMKSIGQYFDRDDGSTGGIGDSPFYTEDKGGACQQAYAIAMTDGYWNGNTPSVGNADGGTGAPYQDSYSDTLADVAMYYYDQDLAADLPDELPANNYDKNPRQHLVTFSVSFGREGNIPLDDMNLDGVIDNPGYLDDPYFLNPATPRPSWGNPHNNCYSCPTKIDDLWHASVNGRGRFFMANNPDALVNSLNELFADISSRIASGASVSVNGDELSTGLILYQSTYSSGNWVGNVVAYPIDPSTGEVKNKAEDILWQTKEKLQDQHWDNGRNIITYTGTPGQGVPFRYANLAPAQQLALGNDANVVDFLRGKEVPDFRTRSRKLGDIVHSAPLLTGKAVKAENDTIDNDEDGLIDEPGEMAGGTLFAGSNDGMLHAFDAQSGRERFAYVPLHSFAYLKDLTKTDYVHRFYVDATPYAADMIFLSGDRTDDGLDNNGDGVIDDPGEDYSDTTDNDGDGEIDEPSEKATLKLLVGALKKGGRGIYALDITNVENPNVLPSEATMASGAYAVPRWEYPPVPAGGLQYVYAGDQTADGVDNDNDGFRDTDANEATNGITENYSDSIDNDGDGLVDEEGEMTFLFDDNDMGYSFSDPFIVRSYKSFNEALSLTDNPWVVIFGNGYDSVNGRAVLYVLDAWTGTLIRKIDTGVGGNNGLSTPALIDVDNDLRIDYVYAGDLKGNMWKFDLTDRDPANWGVAYGTDVSGGNPPGTQRIDYADVDINGIHDTPQPLVSVPAQPITSSPDVAYHCEKGGYMVVFGTGKYLGEADRTDFSQQTIFGIWDFDAKENHSPDNYLGAWNRDTNSLGNGLLSGVKLLEQTQIDWRQGTNYWLRTLSNNKANWYSKCDDGLDNDGDGVIDDRITDPSDPAYPPEPCIPISHAVYASDMLDNNYNDLIDEPGEEIGYTGWFFDLPQTVPAADDGIDNDGDGTIDEVGEEKLAGERVIKDVLIRSGMAIVISFTPGESPCTGGGSSIVHAMDYCDGSRADEAWWDLTGPDSPGPEDGIDVGGETVYPTGLGSSGMWHPPVFVSDDKNERELLIFSSSAGNTVTLWARQPRLGLNYWREY